MLSAAHHLRTQFQPYASQREMSNRALSDGHVRPDDHQFYRLIGLG